MDFLRFLLILLLVVPAATAAAVALLGQSRAPIVRLVSLAAVVLDLVLAIVLTIGFVNARDEAQPIKSYSSTFAPEVVPGADAKDPHKTTWHFLSFGNLGA